MVVVYLAYLVQPVLLGCVEVFVGRATRSLTVTSDPTLARGLPTALVTEKDSRAVSVVSIDHVHLLPAMMHARLARIVSLLLSMLLESDFGKWLASASDVTLVRRRHRCRHIRRGYIIYRIGAFTCIKRCV